MTPLRTPRWSNRRKGQWLVEYAILVMAVVAALLVMSNYVRRAFNTKADFIQKELSGG